MKYKQAIEYLNSFYNYERSVSQKKEVLSLSRMKELDILFKCPHRAYDSIHIAGTKGKGSTANILSEVLQKSGYKVGLYTSPHIIDIRERIQINGRMIPKRNMIELVKAISHKRYAISKIKPTYFEILTMIAFEYFKKRQVDIAIIETGLGGRFDATNIVDPIVSVITDISIDHTKELGNTLEKIALEKAGIIKKNRPCVSSSDNKNVERVIKKVCRQKRADYYSGAKSSHIKSRLKGEHQQRNMQTCYRVLGLLKDKGYVCKKKDITKVFSDIMIPGRFEVIKGKPVTIFDGAHNRKSAECLCKTLEKEFTDKKKVFVLGILNNKDIKGICSELSRISADFILFKPENPRAADPLTISKYLPSNNIIIEKTSKKAYNKAKEQASYKGVVIVTGSFYAIGQIKKDLQK